MTGEKKSVALVLAAAFMLLADVSIVNIAAPSIQQDLGAVLLTAACFLTTALLVTRLAKHCP